MEEQNYNIGEYVYYVALGICKVTDFVNMSGEDFIVLVSVNEKNPLKIFVPLSNQDQLANINEPLTKDDINKVLNATYKDIEWNTNKRERQEQFMQILHGTNFVDIISLIICLDKRNKQLHEEKKRLSTFDGEIFKKACRLCEESIAYAFDMDDESANKYFLDHVNL